MGLGYVFSHYEVTRPNYERLTDEEWDTWLDSDSPPAPPIWIRNSLASYEPVPYPIWPCYLPVIVK